MNLQGKRVIVTGASRGFGVAVARAFAQAGAHVWVCARSAAQLNETIASVRAVAQPGAKINGQPADVSDPASVESLFDAAVRDMGGLDVLVANAGVYGPKGPIDQVDWAQWVQAIHINLMGVVLTTRAALAPMRKAGGGKIIVLSGGGATKPMPNLSAYAASKAAVVRYAETLAEESAADKIDVNCVAPGELNTAMLDEVIAAGPERVGQRFYEASLKQQKAGGTPMEVGAGLCLYLASSASDGITGKLISAKWDPWKELHTHRADLVGTDIYTLRRIVPAERGKGWGS